MPIVFGQTIILNYGVRGLSDSPRTYLSSGQVALNCPKLSGYLKIND